MFLDWIKTRQKLRLFEIELHRRDREYNLVNLFRKKHYLTNLNYIRNTKLNNKKISFTNLLHFIK